ncbi:MAG TPA: hypothetical protein VK206_08115 [Anaerolineales bacterium]|nr:hypothetical protein [Anaerolineales bacterium]HLO30295.1 hypothetical protein [Anaerolineales bacterium]
MSIQIFKSALAVSLALVFLACSFFIPQAAPTPSAVDIEKEEQAVYSVFVSGQGTVLILRDTSTNISGDNPQQTLDYIKSGLKDISHETLDNYLERNKQPSQLSPDMDLGMEYILLSPEELAKITSQPNWHEILREKYPNSGGYLIFSRVGFNHSLDQALIYVGQVAGPLMGAGYYYLMEKKDGEWKIKEQIMVWIS